MDLERAKQACRGFPGATEDIKWGDVLAFSVGGKMFALCGVEARSTRGMSFKVDAERFLELTDRPGFRPALLACPADGRPRSRRRARRAARWR